MKEDEKHLLCFKEEIVERIEIDVDRSGTGCQERSPLPTIILGIQQEIYANNRHGHSHHNKNHKNEQHESVDVVNLVGPE